MFFCKSLSASRTIPHTVIIIPTVKKTSIFPASREKVFSLLKQLETLQFIASPYASFTSIDDNKEFVWQEGMVFKFKFKLFGIIPYGIHTINVIKFDNEIYTNESNTHVPIWNHRITLKECNDGKTEYTDEVEIGAGWKTLFIYLWAKCFYSHRQKKWIKLLSK